MDFWRAYRVLARRKWIIIAAVIVTTGVVGTGVMLWGQVYDASTVFGATDSAIRSTMVAGNVGTPTRVLDEEERVTETHRIMTEVRSPNFVSMAVYALAASDRLYALLMNAGLDLDQGGSDYDVLSARVKELVSELPQEQVKSIEKTSGLPVGLWDDFVYLDIAMRTYNVNRADLRPDRLPDTISQLSRKVESERPNTRTVILKVRDRSPRMAEIYANAITAVYRYQYDTRANEATMKQLAFYEAKHKEAQRASAAAQAALLRWRKANGRIFEDNQVEIAIRKGDEARTQTEALEGALNDMDSQIASKNARLAKLPKSLTRTTKVEDPEVARLRDQMSTLQADLALKRGTQTESNPEVRQLKEKLESVTRRYNQVKGNLISQRTVVENEEWTRLEQEIAQLKQTRDGAAAKMSVLQKVMAESNRVLEPLPQTRTEGQRLESANRSATERLALTAGKLEQAREDASLVQNTKSLNVMFWAGMPPGTRDHPQSAAQRGGAKRTMVMVLGALLVSLFASTAIILGLDFLDTSIKTPFDAERMLQAPVSAIVPRLDGPARAALPMVTHNLPASPHAESYRFLGTDILISATGENPYKSIMVATAKPGQGGTSTICNLAITLAQAGQTVALVDADMRRPSLHRIFSLDNEEGLTTVLENGRQPSDALQRTDVENLYVMTGGPMSDNAWKLLRSAKMKDVIADLSRDFDFVLFDTPSAAVFADAATLATLVDGVLLVVRAHEAPSGSELQVKGLLNKTKARIVAVVLNDMPAQQVDSARFYNHYYAPGSPRQEQEMAASGPMVALPQRGSADDEI